MTNFLHANLGRLKTLSLNLFVIVCFASREALYRGDAARPSASTKFLVFVLVIVIVLVIDLPAFKDHDYEYDQDYEDFLREKRTTLELAAEGCIIAHASANYY